MMSEMVRIKEVSNPDEVLLVVDSMIGQEAADLTKSFHEKVGITGAILTLSLIHIPSPRDPKTSRMPSSA